MYLHYHRKATRNFSVNWNDADNMFVFEIPKSNLGTLVSGEHMKKRSQSEKEVTEVTS